MSSRYLESRILASTHVVRLNCMSYGENGRMAISHQTPKVPVLARLAEAYWDCCGESGIQVHMVGLSFTVKISMNFAVETSQGAAWSCRSLAEGRAMLRLPVQNFVLNWTFEAPLGRAVDTYYLVLKFSSSNASVVLEITLCFHETKG
ncbi:hypothetical protein CC1G_14802 [Coprinopsis cinerea okayama7|uniref:Uncharacterized protein n=1 Tax=Coprinopsis cinerea (strain Okayama-7 / 130 / ATCC MYA-4618 / FGSC 9003) TaxID=240176 RepID=D6RNI2_COPC7|nr:hypothetical protein CC1G_14802 [Coprinopsis cinerea okayama7\|eukprot:XP_002910823.1 hypothetical protein CC1G_14802 [Coprinopsis cinerea okayama7\